MLPAGKTVAQAVANLNKGSPAFADAKLADLLNNVAGSINTLSSAFNAFLAHLDAANNGSLGTANAATYGVTGTAPTVGSL